MNSRLTATLPILPHGMAAGSMSGLGGLARPVWRRSPELFDGRQRIFSSGSRRRRPRRPPALLFKNPRRSVFSAQLMEPARNLVSPLNHFPAMGDNTATHAAVVLAHPRRPVPFPLRSGCLCGCRAALRPAIAPQPHIPGRNSKRRGGPVSAVYCFGAVDRESNGAPAGSKPSRSAEVLSELSVRLRRHWREAGCAAISASGTPACPLGRPRGHSRTRDSRRIRRLRRTG